MSEHAILAPSGANKWSNCPASLQLEKQAVSENPGVNNSNIYADTGTIAHMMGEICLNYGVETKQFEDMTSNVKKYVDYVKALCSPTSHYKVEQRIEIFNNCWGTADCVLFDVNDLHVIDLKYGKGLVSAEENKQMSLYAYGVLQTPDAQHITRVTLHIVMPRGKNSSFTYTKQEIETRGKDLKLNGQEALDENNLTMNPSEKACQWCKAIWICPAKQETRTKDFDIID